MTRRESLALLAATLARAAGRLPANRNVKWGLGSNLWNYFPRVPFTDILDVMKDTGFIGLRVTQFPQILKTYDITAAQMQKEADEARLPHRHHFLQRPHARPGAPRRSGGERAHRHDFPEGVRREPPGGLLAQSQRTEPARPRFKAMCECFNEIGRAAE